MQTPHAVPHPNHALTITEIQLVVPPHLLPPIVDRLTSIIGYVPTLDAGPARTSTWQLDTPPHASIPAPVVDQPPKPRLVLLSDESVASPTIHKVALWARRNADELELNVSYGILTLLPSP
jgi:hypothetical protein